MKGEELKILDIIQKGSKILIVVDDKGILKYSQKEVKLVQNNAKAKKNIIL